MNDLNYYTKNQHYKNLVNSIPSHSFNIMYAIPCSLDYHVSIIDALIWLKDDLKRLIRHHKDHIAKCKMTYMPGLLIHSHQLLKCENQMREYNKLICQARHSKRVLVKIGGLNE